MQICGCFLSCCGVASNSPGSLKYPLMALFQAELASPHFHVAVIIIDGKKILSILFSFVLNSAIGPLLFFFFGGGVIIPVFYSTFRSATYSLDLYNSDSDSNSSVWIFQQHQAILQN